MIFILLRKINKNKWMILCLLLGLILSVGIVSSIPMYSRAILHRVLTRGVEGLKVKDGIYPGSYLVSTNRPFSNQMGGGDKLKAAVKDMIKKNSENTYPSALAGELKLPINSEKKTLAASEFTVLLAGENAKYEPRPQATMKGISNFQDHIKITEGKMSSKTKNENGDYEVIASEYAFNNLRLKLDTRYKVNYRPETGLEGKPFYVTVTGIYSYKDDKDPFFDSSVWYNPESLVMDYDLYVNEWMKNEDMVVGGIEWYFALDYSKINAQNYEEILKKIEAQKITASKEGFSVVFPGENVLRNYSGKKKDMTTMLWVLQAPMLLMLLIYISMMSRLIVQQDKNEISLLKSRGAGTFQIIPIYLLESLFMGIIAFIFGPLLGRLICIILGSSNGFLQFVQREPLRIDIRLAEFVYSIIAILIFIITMMIPVISASRKSIVEQKQSKVRYVKKPAWLRFYLDFILLGITGYGYYSFKMRQVIAAQAETSPNSLPVDPLLYMVSTFFVIGLGLLFLRIYPYIIKFIFILGKRRWSPSFYSSLINVGRSDGKNQFVMLFLILTVCIGIFNLKAAGTINENMEQNIRYKIGADAVIKIEKEKKEREVVEEDEKKLNLTNYASYAGLNGVSKSTKVFKETNAKIKYGTGGETASMLMGITPHEFGEIAWFSQGILPFHINEYLNILTKEPRAMILSKSFESKYGFKVGDNFQIKTDNGSNINGFVAAFIDYWPSIDLRAPDAGLVIANQEYLSKHITTRPYEVWIKKKSPDSGQQIFEDLKKKQIEYYELLDANEDIINEKNDPMLQGINGSLTLGFGTTIIITIIGFLIYWIMSIKERTLQFGILRSIGLSFRKLIEILSIEQVLISGTSIIMGVIIGELNTLLFLPMLKMSSSTSKQLLPFRIMSLEGQYLSLYIVIILMLVFVSIILGRYIKGIKMDQAVKLGED